jgi:hypothetical protein
MVYCIVLPCVVLCFTVYYVVFYSFFKGREFKSATCEVYYVFTVTICVEVVEDSGKGGRMGRRKDWRVMKFTHKMFKVAFQTDVTPCLPAEAGTLSGNPKLRAISWMLAS